jgi:hypothetical protein
MQSVPGVTLETVSGAAIGGSGVSVIKAVAVPFPALVTVRSPVTDCPSPIVPGLKVTAVTSSGRPHCQVTATVLAGPATFTVAETPVPMFVGGVPVSVATVALPVAGSKPTVQTCTRGDFFFGAHVTPAAGARLTAGVSDEVAGNVSMTFVTLTVCFPVLATVTVDVAEFPGRSPTGGCVADTITLGEAAPAVVGTPRTASPNVTALIISLIPGLGCLVITPLSGSTPGHKSFPLDP